MATKLLYVALGLLYAAYPFAVHWALAGAYPLVAVGLAAIALASLCWTVFASWSRWIGLVLIATLVIAGAAFRAAFSVAILPPLLINLGMAMLFASTLANGHEPMITRFARIERGALEPDLCAYTRCLTWLWTIFFVAMAIISLTFSAWSPRVAWVWFTSIGNYLCVGALFVGEYIYRRRRYSHYRHASPVQLFDIVRASLHERR